MSDPNFPPDLDISPLSFDKNNTWQQHEAIERFGIAGRIWEATELLIQYFTPGTVFDPPCSIFADRPKRVIELGSGQSVASLHLAASMSAADTLILTDLPEVIPLCEQSLAAQQPLLPQVIALPLAWGSTSSHLPGPFSHIIMCDLVYFPNLYPLLLFTLLALTEDEVSDSPTFGPEIILAYKPRTLALEHSFFDSFGHYFSMNPIIGGDSDVRLYSCFRWQITEEWKMPTVDTVMNGTSGIVRGRDFGYIDQMFASMDW